MQRFAQEIKGPLWTKLRVIFDKYANGADFISVQTMETVVKEVLMEESPGEIDYVIRNVGRIDTDNNGTIDFEEFGNFILKRHCGEMALQKMHKCNQIKNSSVRKITETEFKQLLNASFYFLSVKVDDKVIPELFNLIDKDRDGLITYPQYFGFTDVYILEAKPVQKKSKDMQTINFKSGTQKQQQQTQQTQKTQQTQPLEHSRTGKAQSVKEFQSRLRNFLMSELKRIFVAYDQDSNSLLDPGQLRLLLIEIFGIAPKEVLKISSKYFKPDSEGRSQSFSIFVPNFLHYASELGWFGLQKTLPQGRTNINQQEFIRLIGQTFNKLNIEKVDRALLIKFFGKLDTNRDGFVEISDYKNWISKFLSPPTYSGTEYYLQEDDSALSVGKNFIKELGLTNIVKTQNRRDINMPSVRIIEVSPAKSTQEHTQRQTTTIQHQLKFQTRSARRPSSSSRISESGYSVNSTRSIKSSRELVARFNFNSQDLAKRVRKQMLFLLAKLDTNRNKQFEESEIISTLQHLMKSDKTQVQYVIANVFRYDKNGDNIVTYEELANFFLEIHCGELAIQRLHKEDAFEKGSQRIMNLAQFERTVEYALSFIEIDPSQGELAALFRDIDQNKDGWISYQEYFEFLIHYFGTQSAVARGQLRSKIKTVYNMSSSNESPPEERFSKLIRSQTRVLVIGYDKNKNLKIERDQAMAILNEVLDQSQQETTLTLNTIYGKKQTNFEYDQIVNKILEIHSSETILVRLFKHGLLRHSAEKMLDLEDFVVLINSAFVYLPVLPTRNHYEEIFHKISSSGSDLVTFREYQHFVAKYLGKCDSRSFSTVFEAAPQHPLKSRNSSAKPSTTDKALIDGMVRVFREHYNNVDPAGQGLTKDVLEQLLVTLFGSQKKKDIDYLLWTAYRMDQDLDGKINFQQSIPLVFKVEAQLVLNDLHRSNPNIELKEKVSSQQFATLLQTGFPFFDFKKLLPAVFQRLDSDKDGFISDREYLSWVLSVNRSIS